MKPDTLQHPLVIDTSVVAKWFLPEPLGAEAETVLLDVRQGRLQLASPDLIVYEFANILWLRRRKGEIGSRQANLIMSDFERLPIELAPADALGFEALKIACKTGCTAYDGAFVALAVGLKSTLLTADQRLLRAVEKTTYANHVSRLGH